MHADPDRYIRLERGRYAVRIFKNGTERRYGVFPTRDEARAVRDTILGAAEATPPTDSSSQTPDTDFPSPRAAYRWQHAITKQHEAAIDRGALLHTLTIPDEPIGIAFPSDLHIGGQNADYVSLLRDARTIRDTPGMHAIFAGDATDNWIVGKLQALQRHQIMKYDDELLMLDDWLTMIGPSLLAIVSGNHDLWTFKVAGADHLAEKAKDLRILYGQHHVAFMLKQGATSRIALVRHKWRYNSVFNPTHGLEVGWDRGDLNYDWAVGGHTHIGTLCRPFYRHNRMRHAILIGTYKTWDSFGDEINVASSKGKGCGVMICRPNGAQLWIEDVQEAAEYLTWLRSRHR